MKISLKRSIKTASNYFIIIALVTALGGCSKESPKKSYIARVNNSYLTSEELGSMVDTSRHSLYRNEIIRNWINKELLYQKALKDGITDDKEFNRVINDTRKELAVTLYLDRLYEKEMVKPEASEVEEYFDENKNDFRLFYDTYVINKIDFNNEDKAIRFRTALLESDWVKTVNAFKGDPSILDTKSNQLDYEFELQPAALRRIVKELNQNEISIVFSDAKDIYTVVQLVQKFRKGDLPPFGFIRELVKRRLEAQRKEDFLKNYIKELYSKNDIEVKNQD